MSRGITPTQRTLRELKKRGFRCAIVEKFNAFVGPHGIRQDLFGIIDILVLNKKVGVIGVQSTGSAFSEHLKKLLVTEAGSTRDWLETPGTRLELWGWRKLKEKRGGKRVIWVPRIREIFLSDLETSEQIIAMDKSEDRDGDDGQREIETTEAQGEANL